MQVRMFVLVAALYALGMVLMGRRLHALATLELSDEPMATPPARRVPLTTCVLWPLAVALRAGADLWGRVARFAARPRSPEWRS